MVRPIHTGPSNPYATSEQAKQWVGGGWASLVDRCFAACVASGLPFTVAQVKEKFGQLRFYVDFTFDRDTQDEFMRAEYALNMISAAEVESGRTCEVCGAPGSRAYAGGYWVKTRCDGCLTDRDSRTPRTT